MIILNSQTWLIFYCGTVDMTKGQVWPLLKKIILRFDPVNWARAILGNCLWLINNSAFRELSVECLQINIIIRYRVSCIIVTFSEIIFSLTFTAFLDSVNFIHRSSQCNFEREFVSSCVGGIHVLLRTYVDIWFNFHSCWFSYVDCSRNWRFMKWELKLWIFVARNFMVRASSIEVSYYCDNINNSCTYCASFLSLNIWGFPFT